ncbi:MAG TPA: FIST N-terminal domain-containing protein [Anaerolineaceae bacterium]|nr:FIST N-terminal domain-containing protein [Anaerolineaceae bacterium]
MKVRAISTVKNSVNEAVSDLLAQAKGFQPKMVVYFASTKYDPSQISASMEQAFPGATVFGCSTAGEIVSGEMFKGSISAMLVSGQVLEDIDLAVVENIAEGAPIPAAFDQFEAYFHAPMAAMDVNQYVGIVLMDGLSRAEERLMEKIGDLTSVFFVGGSAGDDLKFEKTYVYAHGKAYRNAAILALLKPVEGFGIIKTQSFFALGASLEATRVDEPNRKVVEFNHKPALQAYADALRATPEEAKNQFMEHPLGLMLGGEPYVRSPQKVEGQEMVFYCNIREGSHLSILQSTDIVGDTRAAVAAKAVEMGGISGILNFHCILRTLELENTGLTQAYGKVFTEIPTAGFSTYGEAYLGHINQTSTMLVFK